MPSTDPHTPSSLSNDANRFSGSKPKGTRVNARVSHTVHKSASQPNSQKIHHDELKDVRDSVIAQAEQTTETVTQALSKKAEEVSAHVAERANTVGDRVSKTPLGKVGITVANHVEYAGRAIEDLDHKVQAVEDGINDKIEERIQEAEERVDKAEPQLIKEARAQIAPPYIKLDFTILFWIFVIGSILGLVVEDVFHYLVYHNMESRAGLVWGPFSSIYGVGAVILTLFLNRFYYTHNLIIFLIAMVLGSALEYGTSWMMETFWHAIAWDYTGTFGSIDGRTNFVFGVMWGILGLFWVRWIMPLIKSIIERVNVRSTLFRIINLVLVIFMTVNIIVTILALHREGQRTQGIPPANSIDQMLDDHFPDWWMQQRFQNMTVSADLSDQKGGGTQQSSPDEAQPLFPT